MARIVLVNTNRMRPVVAPVGLEYVGEALQAQGHTVVPADLALAGDAEAELRSALSEGADLVGLTVRNTDEGCFGTGESFLPRLRDVVDLVRRLTDAPIVAGGCGFSCMPEAVLDALGLDLGVWADGEEALSLLLARLQAGEPLHDVPHVVFRDGGRWHRGPVRFADLATIPPRRRHLFDNPRFLREGGQLGVETKRGCPLRCTYCADPVAKGPELRLRPPALVAAELRALLDQGITHFHLCDPEFNVPRGHAAEVCRAIIEAGLGDQVQWYAYAKVAPFDRELARLCRQAGCVGIDFGADNANADVLRSLGRDYGPDALRETARLCHEAGLVFMYDLLLGGPAETADTIRETIELMRAIGAPAVGISAGVRVCPGTPLAEELTGQEADLICPTGNPSDPTAPRFYIAPSLRDSLHDTIADLVGDDPRFVFERPQAAGETSYNYSDNQPLVEAIARGARGAFWDILRRLRTAAGA